MCSEKDCQIFRGMITACDMCRKMPNASSPRLLSACDAPAPPGPR
ncbi:MAG: hypothetical protein AB1793_01700 [Candidatus Thermoplasmatota archaeon]